MIKYIILMLIIFYPNYSFSALYLQETTGMGSHNFGYNLGTVNNFYNVIGNTPPKRLNEKNKQPSSIRSRLQSRNNAKGENLRDRPKFFTNHLKKKESAGKLVEIGKIREAKQQYNELLTAAESALDYLSSLNYEIAGIYDRELDHVKAFEAYANAYNYKSNNIFYYISFGEALLERNRYNEAETVFNNAINQIGNISKTNSVEYKKAIATASLCLTEIQLAKEDYTGAEKNLATALKIRKALALANQVKYELEVIDSLVDQAIFYENLGQTDKIQECLQEALSINVRLRQVKKNIPDPDAARNLVNLGILHEKSGHFFEAEQAYKSAIIIRESLTLHKPEVYWSDLASTTKRLGNLYFSTKQFSEAEAQYLRELKMCKKYSKSGSVGAEALVADAFSDLAEVYESSGKQDKAIKFQQDAVDIYGNLSKKDASRYEPIMAADLTYLAFLIADSSWNKAEEAILGALAIYRKLSLAEPTFYQRSLASFLCDLSDFYLAKGYRPEGEKYLRDALIVYRGLIAGSQKVDNDFATTALKLASLTTDYNEAANLYKEILSFYRLLGPSGSQPYVAQSLIGLGTTLAAAGHSEESKKAYEDALSEYEAILAQSKDSPDGTKIMTLLSITKIQMALKQSDKAKETLQRSFSICERTEEVEGTERPYISYFINDIAYTYLNLNMISKAEAAFRKQEELYASSTKLHDPNTDKNLAAAYNGLGLLRLKTDPAESIHYFKKSKTIYEKLYQSQFTTLAPVLADTVSNIAICYYTLHYDKDAEAAYKEAEDILRKITVNNSSFKMKLAQKIMDTGSFYLITNQPKAVDSFEEAARLIDEKYGSTLSIQKVECLKSLALSYAQFSELAQSEVCYGEAISIVKELSKHDRSPKYIQLLADLQLEKEYVVKRTWSSAFKYFFQNWNLFFMSSNRSEGRVKLLLN